MFIVIANGYLKLMSYCFCRSATKVFPFWMVSSTIQIARRISVHCCIWPPKEHNCDFGNGWKVFKFQKHLDFHNAIHVFFSHAHDTFNHNHFLMHPMRWPITFLCIPCSFYRCEYDPVAGGEMKQLECYNFLKTEEAF